jgi:hypothetical protein
LFDEPNADKTRGWAAATGGGLVAGGVLAAILSVPADPATTAELPAMKLPSIGVLPVKRSLGEVDAPAFGVTWSGEIW